MAIQKTSRFNAQKFAMWAGMAGMVMLFAALTSAYLVRKGGGNWQVFRLPVMFWFSTAIVIISSFTLRLAIRNFKSENYRGYKLMMGITVLLGVLFMLTQLLAWMNMWNNGLLLSGNPSIGFVYVIGWIHAAHMIGGIVTLLVLFLIAVRKKYNPNRLNGIEIAGMYWHFVGAVWVYLFIFFQINL